jgi:hypothetical protein
MINKNGFLFKYLEKSSQLFYLQLFYFKFRERTRENSVHIKEHPIF